MEEQFKYVLYLAACGAMGREADPPCSPLEWNSLVKLAEKQGLKPFIAYAVKKSANTGCPDEIKKELVNDLRAKGIKYHLGRRTLIELQWKLKQAGISSAILKGYALAESYKVPELRIGCDVDLYVSQKDEKKAVSWFVKEGFSVVEERHWGEVHGVLKREDIGLLELHASLHGDCDSLWWSHHSATPKEMWSVTQPFLELDTPDGCIQTISVDEHAVFLCLHMLKHLIDETKIIARMFLDIGVYFERYKNEICWERFWSFMEAIQCKHMMCTVIRTIQLYMELAVDMELHQQVSDADISRLQQVFDDGFAVSGEERFRVNHEFNAAVLKVKKGKYIYKAWTLSRYARMLGGRIKQHGLKGAVKLAGIRFNQVMLGKYSPDQNNCEHSGNSRLQETTDQSDQALEFFRSMGMM